MEMICVDTNIVIDHANDPDKDDTYLLRLAGAHEKIYVTAVTAYEFLRGDDPKEKEKWETYLSDLGVLPFDEDAAKVAAELDKDLKAKGVHPGTEDLLIGAIAKSKGFTLATRNAKHFDRIEGLEVQEL